MIATRSVCLLPAGLLLAVLAWACSDDPSLAPPADAGTAMADATLDGSWEDAAENREPDAATEVEPPDAQTSEDASTPQLAVTSALQLSSTTIRRGERLTGTATLTNPSSVTKSLENVVIAARPPGGTNAGGPYLDLYVHGPAVIGPGGTLTLSGGRAFTSSDSLGGWYAYVTWEDETGFHDDATKVTFTVVEAAGVDAGAKPHDAGTSHPDAGTKPPDAGVDSTFSIVVLPDVQREIWDDSSLQNFLGRMNWIVANKAAEDIRFVIQVGDLTDTDNCGKTDVVDGQCSDPLKANGTYFPIPARDSHYHFTNVNKGLQILDQAQIPYGLSLGNHDTAIVCGGPACYGHPEWGVPPSSQVNLFRITKTWNRFFPLSRFKKAVGVYETGKTDNLFHEFTAGGVEFLVLNLELWPRVGAMNWAKGVIAANPHKNVILVTHSFLTGSGTVGGMDGYGETRPETLRDVLVRPYSNVKLVFSGHTGNNAHWSETRSDGTVVHAFLDCYHDTTNNRTRVVTFDVSKNRFTTRVYSPKTNLTTEAATSYPLQFVR